MSLYNNQQVVFDAVVNGDNHILCHGDRGSGKTYLAHRIQNWLSTSETRKDKDVMFIPEPTTNMCERLPFLIESIPSDRRDATDTIVVDGLRCTNSLFYAKLSSSLSLIFDENASFGGKRVILMGDFSHTHSVTESRSYVFISSMLPTEALLFKL